MDQTNKPARTRRSTQEVLKLLELFKTSGGSVEEFCRVHHISQGSFHKWKARHTSKSTPSQKPVGFAAVHITPSAWVNGAGGLFAQVGDIKIYQPVSASFLKELL